MKGSSMTVISPSRWAGGLTTWALLVGVLPHSGALQAQSQSWKTITASREFTGEAHLSVSVSYGAGGLTIRSGPPSALYRYVLRLEEETSSQASSYADGELEIDVTNGTIPGSDEHGSLNLALPRTIPLDISVNFGAGRANLDLSGLRIQEIDVNTGAASATLAFDEPNPERVRSAEFKAGAAELVIRRLGNLNADEVRVETGVGSVDLDLSGAWPQESQLSARVGLGALTLRIPALLGVRLEHGGFLASVDTDGMIKVGDAHQSRNWNTAEHRLHIDVSATLGSVDLIWGR